jgi:hypothetical protein
LSSGGGERTNGEGDRKDNGSEETHGDGVLSRCL